MTQSVQAGKTVCLQYTLSLANGTPVDSSSESGTWTYVHGHTRMPAGLVKGVEGLTAGTTSAMTLAPEDAFGAGPWRLSAIAEGALPCLNALRWVQQ
jgi:FKBP-type peptidyl-prolyl cis-trans isomerase 2